MAKEVIIKWYLTPIQHQASTDTFHSMSELDILGRFSHPNLVKLLGYYWEENELLLVYEFVPKDFLEKHLFGWGSAIQPLPWDIRLNMLIGAARGLEFLHTSDKQVIYRHFKTSNMLLDESYNVTAIEPRLTTPVMGTYGYAAPEYIATWHLYMKSDVYAYGVVLVEMLTGLRVFDGNSPSEQSNLVDWVKPYLLQERKLAINESSCGNTGTQRQVMENPWILCTIDLHFPAGKREFRPINLHYEHGSFDIMLPMKSGL
ncbi:hypothetical protein RHGRI_029551 [Rhododendron griersonianum]|uniref:Protein kinase domain-containing protein n=1 Tax=Rhododendron griersonianum TaxID=479676 RepID=A0AAV6IPJ6_9ERIC|nr:hypothetical protein RHGRI_029551 [Rhododendron griersonianum]